VISGKVLTLQSKRWLKALGLPESRGEVVVPGDPTLCRQYARECTEMAERAVSPDHQQLLANLAQSWLSVALELERSTAVADVDPAEPAVRGAEATEATY
jgi:hypothetical protein